MDEKYRFISDAMLGSLTKWLRIVGYDTVYFRSIDDHELIRIAMQQQRIILTKDTGLAKTKKMNQIILIHSNYTGEQLKEVLLHIRKESFKLPELPPRCISCNGELLLANKEYALDNVPEYIFLKQKNFLECMNCGKVFWHGSHKKNIDETINGILEEIET